MKWISVKESLPKHHSMVLVFIPDDILIGINHVVQFYSDDYGDSHKWQTINGSHIDYTLYANVVGVTHWMPLPTPPID